MEGVIGSPTKSNHLVSGLHSKNLIKIVHNFLSNRADKQTDRQTDRPKNTTSFGGGNNKNTWRKCKKNSRKLLQLRDNTNQKMLLIRATLKQTAIDKKPQI